MRTGLPQPVGRSADLLSGGVQLVDIPTSIQQTTAPTGDCELLCYLRDMSLNRKTPLRPTTKGFSKKKKPTIGELLDAGKLSSAKDLRPKRRIRPRSKKNAGWWDVALEIWEESDHVCEVCDRDLGDHPSPSFFSHLLPRGSYPEFKRRADNIRLKDALCHEKWHKYGPERLQALTEWKDTCDRYFALRDEANGLIEPPQ